MAVFSTNQVHHLYVAKTIQNSALSAVGDIKVKTVGDYDKSLYFEVMGANGALKSDYIPVKGITSIKKVTAAAQATKLKSVVVTLDSSLLTSSNLNTTEVYVLRIAFRQFYGMSDQDQYFKDVAVQGVSGTSKTNFYAALADALNKAFAREVGATATSNPYLAFSSSASGLVISEKEQPWTLGVEASERVYFEVVPTEVITSSGASITWGTVTDNTATYNTTVNNSKKICDLEYFCLGARGDQYRNVGWPNVVETKGVAEVNNTGYDVIEIHYTFSDTGVNSYNTEKDITIATPALASGAIADDLLAAINTAVGTSAGAIVPTKENVAAIATAVHTA